MSFWSETKSNQMIDITKSSVCGWNFLPIYQLKSHTGSLKTHLCNVSQHQLANGLKNGDSFHIQRGLFFFWVVRNLWARWLPFFIFHFYSYFLFKWWITFGSYFSKKHLKQKELAKKHLKHLGNPSKIYGFFLLDWLISRGAATMLQRHTTSRWARSQYFCQFLMGPG